MIQRDITLHAAAPACACGRSARIIHSSGHAATDPRLLGLPAEQFHVECVHCGIATAPQLYVGVARNDWRLGLTHPIGTMPALRVALDLARLREVAAA